MGKRRTPAPDTAVKTRVVAYTRVSTERQADEGVSLEAQRAKLEAYADLYGLEVVAFIEDPGESAESLDRPGLTLALAMLDRGEADGLLAAKLDRLTRRVRDLDILLSGWFGRDDGPALLLVGDHVDTRSASGRMVLNIIASVAQWERESIVERILAALAHKRARGERIGTVPFGFTIASDGVALVEHPVEQEAIRLVEDLRSEGLSIRAIAAELAARGVPPRGSRWHPTTVARLLRRT